MRAPLGRRQRQVSETAISKPGAGAGWIERALEAMPEAGAQPPLRIKDLMDQITSARVGGTFWAPPPVWSDTVKVVVSIDKPSQLDDRLGEALTLAQAGEIGVIFTGARAPAELARSLARRGVNWSAGPVDPWAVLKRAEAVIVGGDDELGLLALISGRKVHCRAPGYLAGWGVSQDAATIPRRGRRQVWQVAAAALVSGVRYLDPYSGRMSDCETIVDQLAEWRRVVDEDRGLACCAGIALWKRSRVMRFLAPEARRVPVLRHARACIDRARRTGGDVAVWPSRAPRGLDARARETQVAIRRVEDGFVRSVGLGSDLLPPCSIVIDRRGIYYDPSRPSDLELILSETVFTPALLARARRLSDTLVARGLTKYNTGGAGYARPARRRVVLVTGQVEDDQSWRLGGGDCSGNLDLLRRVRHHETDAFIVYKPHPDVEAGNRVGAVPDDEVLKYADQIVRDVATPALFDSVDALHVLTSLAGFEALLRGREVVVHGQPFYSGWGLTTDLSPPPRRGRRLSLDELVAGTLILYPRYIDPVTGLLCSPEILVERLAQSQQGARASVVALRRIRRLFEGGIRLANRVAPVRRASLSHD